MWAAKRRRKRRPEDWLKATKPPYLLELIARYGAYEAVPMQAWAAFGDAKVEWEKRRKARAGRPCAC
jgi:hypothetical protein